MTVYPFIEAEKVAERNVARACELLEVSRSAYYAQRDTTPSPRQVQEAELTAAIVRMHEASKGVYGAPKIHDDLKDEGRQHGRKRVARIMRLQGLCGKTPKRFKTTTVADPQAAARADLIKRDCTVDPAKINTPTHRPSGQFPRAPSMYGSQLDLGHHPGGRETWLLGTRLAVAGPEHVAVQFARQSTRPPGGHPRKGRRSVTTT